jgi:hypothetical protein
VRLGRLGQLKTKKKISSGMEPATFRLVSQCLNQLRKHDLTFIEVQYHVDTDGGGGSHKVRDKCTPRNSHTWPASREVCLNMAVPGGVAPWSLVNIICGTAVHFFTAVDRTVLKPEEAVSSETSISDIVAPHPRTR